MILVFVKIPLLIGLLYLFIQQRNAMVCAGIWAAVMLVLALVLGTPFSFGLILGVAVSALLCLGYFALLDYLEDSSWWWPAMIIGLGLLGFWG